MNHSQSTRRASAMATRLGDWPNSWLLLRCGRCRTCRRMPIILLCTSYGEDHVLSAVVSRLRCHVTTCRARPDYVRLAGRHNAQLNGHLHSVLLVSPGAYG